VRAAAPQRRTERDRVGAFLPPAGDEIALSIVGQRFGRSTFADGIQRMNRTVEVREQQM
jgi:hypothetical protein